MSKGNNEGKGLAFTVNELDRRMHVVEMKYKSGWEQWFLLTSDHHWDNPKCMQNILKADLEEAKKRNAGIFCFGDTFCAMQGKYDRRSSKKDLRPEHSNGNYLDSLVSTATDWYAPYAENLVLVSPGNHETAIQKRHETDLTERFVSGMNLMHRPELPVHLGGYHGYVVFNMRHKAGGNSKNIRLAYHHGAGGGGPVTLGVIQTNRRQVYLSDADIVVSGHIHEKWNVTRMVERINIKNRLSLKEVNHVCCSTYKEEYATDGGFHVENGRPPKPLGGYWLRFYSVGDDILYDLIQTKGRY